MISDSPLFQVSWLRHLVACPWPALLLLPLLLSRLGASPWLPLSRRAEAALVTALALLVTAACGLWLADAYLVRWPVTGLDFADYCSLTAELRHGLHADSFANRSRFPGWVAGLAARRLGIVDGLLVAAWLATAITAVALYYWARTLYDRSAGLSALLATAAIGPLAIATRTLTFYPLIVASTTVAAAATAWAVRHTTTRSVAVAASAIGLCMLTDQRNLVWATPMGLALAFVALRPPTRRRFAALLIPIVFSWLGGRMTYHPKAATLETQAEMMAEGSGAPEYQMAPQSRSANMTLDEANARQHHYRWGRSNPLFIPKTLWVLATTKPTVVTEMAAAGIEQYRSQQILPWAAPVLGGGLLLLWRSRRDWRWLLAIGATTVPFAAALQNAAALGAHVRFEHLGAPLYALTLGVAWSAVSHWPQAPDPQASDPQPPPPLDRRTVVGAFVLGVLVLGLVPTWLSPWSSWRSPYSADQHVYDELRAVSQPVFPGAPPCLQALRADQQDGQPGDFRLVPTASWALTADRRPAGRY